MEGYMFKRVLLASVVAVGFVGTANAADVAPAGYSWDGMYLGAIAGYGWSEGVGNASSCNSIQNIVGEDGEFGYANLCDATADGETDFDGDYLNLDGDFINWGADGAGWGGYDDDNDATGWNFGGQFGINHQATDNFVVGLEMDLRGFTDNETTSREAFDYLHSDFGDYDGTGYVESTSSLDWMTTLRARAGMSFGSENRMLAYATGGAALAVVSSDMKTDYYFEDEPADWCDDCAFGQPSGDDSFLQAGLVVGAGFEYAMTDTISIGVEYLYTKLYGQQDRTVHFYGDDGRGFDVTREVGFDHIQTVNAEINFHF
jgi:opacity protein-like surface antigen